MSKFSAVVYSRPRCMKCRATMKAISSMGIPVEEKQLDDFPEKQELMRQEGWMELPLVEVQLPDELVRWAGFSESSLNALRHLVRSAA